MMKKREISNGVKKIVLIVFLGLFFLIFNSVQAAGLVPCGGPGEDVCTLCHFFVMLDNIIDFLLFRVVPVLGALMIAIGGVMYIISQGKPEMLSRVKSLFTAIIIGLVIIYGAWLIVNLFLTTIGVAEWTGLGTWWEISCP